MLGDLIFGNIGDKIKKLAPLVSMLGIIGSVLLSNCAYDSCKDSYIFKEYALPARIIIIVVGCLFFIISSFLMYGFGELIDLSTDISYLIGTIRDKKNTDYTKDESLSRIEKFREYRELLEAGAITPEEFEEKRAQLLDF